MAFDFYFLPFIQLLAKFQVHRGSISNFMGGFSKNVCSISIWFRNFAEKSRNVLDLQSLTWSKMIQSIRYSICVLILCFLVCVLNFVRFGPFLPILEGEGGKNLPPPRDLTYPRYPVLLYYSVLSRPSTDQHKIFGCGIILYCIQM